MRNVVACRRIAAMLANVGTSLDIIVDDNVGVVGVVVVAVVGAVGASRELAFSLARTSSNNGSPLSMLNTAATREKIFHRKQ